MPPLLVLTTIWLAGPVARAVTHEPGWSGLYVVGFYLPALLGLVGAWGTCRRRPHGRWFATALALLSVALTLKDATRAGTIAPATAFWLVGMPLVVLYAVHLRHADWFRAP